jgi:ABC-type glycerol-3-phosphate transport system substrate-binding protein
VLILLAVGGVTVGALDRYEQKHCRPEYITEDDWSARTKITYWEKWSGFEFDAIKAAVEAYNRTQGKTDRVFVNLVNTSQVNVKTMIFTAGGQPPDLAGNWSIYVAPFAEKGALTALDAFVERDGYDLGAFVTPYLETCRYADKLWAMPIVPATTALFYNRRLFREAGLDPDKPPTSIAELDIFAAKMDKRDEHGNVARIGFLHTEPGWWKWAWGYYFGGRITDGEGYVVPDIAPWARSLEWVESYAKRYGRDTLSSLQSGFGDFDSPQNAFVAERVGMVIQGVWMPNFISRYNRGLEYGVAPFPSEVELEEPVTQVETDCISIPKGARHAEEAWKFIRWLAGPEGAGILCLKQGKHTCLRELPEEFVKANPNPHVKFFHGLAFSKNAYIVGRFPILAKFRDEMGNAFEEVWQGSKDPRTAVYDAKRAAQKELDRNMERWGYTPPRQ